MNTGCIIKSTFLEPHEDIQVFDLRRTSSCPGHVYGLVNDSSDEVHQLKAGSVAEPQARHLGAGVCEQLAVTEPHGRLHGARFDQPAVAEPQGRCPGAEGWIVGLL